MTVIRTFAADDPDLASNENGQRRRRSAKQIADDLDARVRAVGERSRMAFVDPTVTVTHVKPWSLKTGQQTTD